MEHLADVIKLFITWDAFVVTLDTHPVGALIFLMLILAICSAVVAKRKQ